MIDFPTDAYIATMTLDDPHVLRRAEHVEQERRITIADLLRSNQFSLLAEDAQGPYDVTLSLYDNRLHIHLTSSAMAEPYVIKMPVAAFRGIIKDYFLMCESYFDALKHADPYKLQALDMGRRGMHNEGSELLTNLIKEHAVMDFDTSRRLFTLICVLHIR
ncbi:MAG: UPF0262 family protein [Alphaproteobacteria bacterium]|nr:MAG: UPF0262 family protein [Alphaproteobacteria bacterium]